MAPVDVTASDSPSLYTSTNPWKVTSEFKSVAHTRDEYVKVIEDLKARAPEKTKRLNKFEAAHNALISTLEMRLETIDAELAVSIVPFASFYIPYRLIHLIGLFVCPANY